MGNAFPASDVPPRNLLIEESCSSSIEARRAADNSGEGKNADIQAFPVDDGFERRDKDALVKRIDDLEKELYDYQYHMGLLLIEKKTRASEIEKLRRGLAEAKANVKPECTRELQGQELQSGRELHYKLNKLGKQNDVLLAQENEVEDDKIKIQKEKENLKILYNGLQNLYQELIRKRDRLLSLPPHCTTCETCSIILNETFFSSLETLGAELEGDIQNGSHALFSTTKKSRPRLNKGSGSMKAVAMEAEATVEGVMKEIKELPNGGSEDLVDAYKENKLGLVNSDKKQANGEQDLLCHASGATNSSVSGNEGHHKRKKTSDIEICCHGQKHYNLRPSTILKVSISQLQKSEDTLLERDSDADVDYEPANSD